MPIRMFYYGRNGHRYSCDFSTENVIKHAREQKQFVKLEIGNGTVVTIGHTLVGPSPYKITVFNPRREGHFIQIKQAPNGYRYMLPEGRFSACDGVKGWSC